MKQIEVRVLGTEITLSPEYVASLEVGDEAYITLTLEINGVATDVSAPLVVTEELLAEFRSLIFVERLMGGLDEREVDTGQ